MCLSTTEILERKKEKCCENIAVAIACEVEGDVLVSPEKIQNKLIMSKENSFI